MSQTNSHEPSEEITLNLHMPLPLIALVSDTDVFVKCNLICGDRGAAVVVGDMTTNLPLLLCNCLHFPEMTQPALSPFIARSFQLAAWPFLQAALLIY